MYFPLEYPENLDFLLDPQKTWTAARLVELGFCPLESHIPAFLEDLQKLGLTVDRQEGFLRFQRPVENLYLPHLYAFSGKKRRIGKNFRIYRELDSTSEELFRLLAQNKNVEEGTVVFALQQTQGRGRQGNSWYSASSKGLYFSFVLCPRIPVSDFGWITLVIALALVESMQAYPPLCPQVKWPNDVHCEGRKLAGVLVESRQLEPESPVFVAGCGVNLNQDIFPELGQKVSSLKLEANQSIDPQVFCASFFGALENRLVALEKGDKEGLLKQLKACSSTLGKTVEITQKHQAFVGKVEGVTSALRIQLRGEDGVLREFPAETSTLREKM
jgi:BirA family biotin operon repressor/biotin-[acetyl-CoA-carboxylase] ligase